MSLLVTLAPSPASAADSGEPMALPSVDNLPPVQPVAPMDPATTPDLGPPTPAQKWEQGKEILARRTANTKTFAGDLPGSYETKFFAEPVHFDNNGKWANIETALRAGDGDTVENKANEFELNLAEQADSSSLASIEMDSDHSISMRLQGADDVEGDVTKNSVTYEDARTDTDLKLTSKRNGFKEELILSSADAPDRFVYPLDLEGLTAAVEGAGDVVYRDQDGVERARTPHGFMYDSNVDPNSGEPAISNGVTFAIIPHGAGQALEIKLDREWMDSPERDFPVTVDPDTYVFTKGDDTFVMSPFNQNYSSLNELKVGKPDSSSSVARAFLHFDTSQLNGVNVTSSYLFAREKHSWSPTQNPGPAYRVFDSSWTGASMTQFPGNPTDDGSPATGAWWPDGQTNPNRWAFWDITGMARSWAAAHEDNGSVSIRASNEASNLTWKKYHSANTALETTPMITVAYTAGDPFGSTDDAVAVPGYGSGAANVFVRGWAIDPDTTGPIQAHAYAFNPDGSVAGGIALNADKTRTDVGAAYPNYGSNHGYDGNIPVPGPGTYNVCVAAINVGQGNTTWLPCRSVTVMNYPGTPQSAQATANPDGTVKVTWVGPASNGNSAITGFNIQAINTNGSLAAYRLCSWGCRTATFNELVLGTSYTIKVYAQNAVGYSLESTPVNVVPVAVPGAPTSINASAAPTAALIKWTDGPNNSSPASRYDFVAYNATNAQAAPVQKSCLTACSPSNGFLVDSLIPGNAYTVKMTATNAYGTSLQSAASNSVTPESWSSYSVTATTPARGDTSVRVDWTAQTLTLKYVVKAYEGTRPANGVAAGMPVSQVDALGGVTTANVGAPNSTPLMNGTPHYFTVTPYFLGILAGPESEASNDVVPAGAPFPPVDVIAVPGDEEASVMWSPPPVQSNSTPGDNGSPITEYEVVVYPRDETTPVQTIQVQPTSTSTAVTGLVNGTAYDFDVHAKNDAKPRPGLPGTSNATKPAGKPKAPGTVTGLSLGAETAKVTWTTPPSDNGARITAYRIDVSPECPACSGLDVGGKDRSSLINGLEPNTTYSFQVQSVNRKGSSFWSLPSSPVTTPSDPALLPPSDAPRSPINVSQTKQNVFYHAPETKQTPAEGIAEVAWEASPVGPAATSYVVVATAGSSEIQSNPVTGLSVELRGLDTDLSYSFAVVARNADGDSPPAHTGSIKSILGQMDEIMTQSVPNWRVTWAANGPHPETIPVGPQADPGFMWDADGCSGPVGFDLEDSCYRHDFGYHNYGHRLGLATNESFWQEVNDQLLEDMYYQCEVEHTVGETACMGVAVTAWFVVERAGVQSTFYRG